MVTYSAAASDALSGFTGDVHTTAASCSPDSGSTFAAGSTATVSCTSTDLAGSFTITVNPFAFQGFFQPVDNLPMANTVRGGSTVPLKWKLFLYSGGLNTGPLAAKFSFHAWRALKRGNKTSRTWSAPGEWRDDGQNGG